MQKTHQHIINFLNALKDEGFAVGVDTHLQVWTILQRLPQNTTPETIADYLCPLFSQSDLEQAKFHEVFKSHAYLLDLEIQEEKREAEEESHNSKPETDNLKPPRRSKYILIGGLITAALIIISWLIYPYLLPKPVYGCMDKNALNYNPEATIDTAGLCQYPDTVEVCMQEGFANYQDISTLDTIRTIYIACANCCLEIDTTKKKTETEEPKPTPKAKAQKDSTTYIVPFEPKEVNLPDLQPISGTLSYWLYEHKTPIAIVLSLLFLGFFIAKWLYDKKQDEYNVQRSGDDDPPYILPIKITNKKGIAFNEKIKTVFSQLRGREASAVQRINLKKTIDATIKKGGFIDIRYQQQTRPSEYLILIDKNSELNHQAQLFEHVYQLIKQEEVHVARYFYDDDIRYCWNEKHPTGITIERLTHLYSEARLLIFSDGYSFIDRNNNEIAKWLKPVEHWTRRALMTPAPMAGWNFREGILAQVFVMLPANIQGFLQVVDHFETLKSSDLKAWKYEIGKADKPLELDKENFVADLQRHFSPEMFRWIAACAVYPDLHWDLTVRIGHALSEGRENLVTHSNLIELTRLRWFQRGYMTLSVREELLAEENLSKEDRQKVRAVIIEVLEENIPDNKKSYAFKEHQLQLAINHLLLDRIGEDRRKWLKIAAAMQQQGVNDPVSIQALKDKENRFLGFKLPERFVNFFFKGGIRTFGVENWVSITLLCIGLLGIWGTNLLWQNAQYNNPVVLGEDTYGLATARDTVDFYILQEVWNWEQVGNQSASRSAVTLDWETALKNVDFSPEVEEQTTAFDIQDKLSPILAAQFNAYLTLYDSLRYENILQAHQNYTPNPIFEEAIYNRLGENDTTDTYNPTIQKLQLDILQIVGLAEFYTQKEQKGTAFINYLQSEKLTDSTRTNYTQQNVPNLYHYLQYDYVDAKIENRVLVRKNGQFGFLDSLGNPLWTGSLPYNYAMHYNNGKATISLNNNKSFCINKNQERVPCDVERFEMKDERDNIVYKVIKINSKYWMAEDLRYNSLGRKCTLEGRMYRWNEAKKACPQDWRLPTDEEWRSLALFYGGSDEDANDKGNKAFQDIQFEAFNASLSGVLFSNGTCVRQDYFGGYWTNTYDKKGKAINYYLNGTKKELHRYPVDTSNAYTCRCIQDNLEDKNIPQTVFVKGGTFQMGSNENDREKPIHTVNVKDFNIGKYEVTNAEFAAFLNAKGNQEEGGSTWVKLEGSYKDEKCRIQKSGSRFTVESGYENHPIIYASWYGAKAYCKWLSETTGQTYRLPTEAEWEYAARGGNQSKGYKYAGTNTESSLYRYANFCDKNCGEGWKTEEQNDNYAYTAPVGKYLPNELGIYDMSGNIWEWCEDKWHSNYENAPTDGSVWLQNGDNARVLRGGSWSYNYNLCRVAYRSNSNPSNRYNFIGFRVVRGD